MLSLKLALRNIPAHRQRNLIIAGVTAVVSALLFLFLTFSDGEIENIRTGVAGFYDPVSDLLVVNPQVPFAESRGQSTDDLTLAGAENLAQDLAAVPGVQEVVPGWRWWGGNLFVRGERYLDFGVLAIHPRDRQLQAKYRIVQGDNLSAGLPGLLVHRAVLETLPLRVGDQVTLVGHDAFGQAVSAQVPLRGVYEPLLDNPNLYSLALVDPATLASLVGVGPDEAHRLRIRLTPGADVAAVQKALQAHSGSTGTPFTVQQTATDHRTGYTLVFEMVRMLLVALVLLTLLITGFGIMSVVSVNLHDRRREVGTYFCLGSEKPFLVQLYTWEILLVNLGGCAAGLLLGLAIREGVNALQIHSADPGFQIVTGGSVFHLGLSASSFLWIVGGVALITLITALTSLSRALDVAPVEAVRETE